MEKDDSLEMSRLDSPASSQDGKTTNRCQESGRLEIMEKEDCQETSSVDTPASSQDGNTTNRRQEGGGLEIMEKEDSLETSSVDSPASSEDGNTTNRHQEGGGLEITEKEDSLETSSVDSPASSQDGKTSNRHREGGGLEIMEIEDSLETSVDSSASSQDGTTTNLHKKAALQITEKEDSLETCSVDSAASSQAGNTTNHHKEGDGIEIMEKEDSREASSEDSEANSQDGNTTNRHKEGDSIEIMEKEDSRETSSADSPASSQDGKTSNRHREGSGLEIMEKADSLETSVDSSASSQDGTTTYLHKKTALQIMEKEDSLETSSVDSAASSQDGNTTIHHKEGDGIEIMEKEDSRETISADSEANSQDGNTTNRHKEGDGIEIMEKEDSRETSSADSPASCKDGSTSNRHKECGLHEIMGKEDSLEMSSVDSPGSSQDGNTTNQHKEGGSHKIMQKEDSLETSSVDSPGSSNDGNTINHHKKDGGLEIMEKEDSVKTSSVDSPASSQDGNSTNSHKEGGGLKIMEGDSLEASSVDSPASSQDGNTTNRHRKFCVLEIMEKKDSLETTRVDSPGSSEDGNTTNRYKEGSGIGVMEKEDSPLTSSVDSPASSQDGNTTNNHKEGGGLELKTPVTDLYIQKIVIPVENPHEECDESNFVQQHPIIANDTEVQKTDFLPSDSEGYKNNNKEDDNKNEKSSGPKMDISAPFEKLKSLTTTSEHIGSVTDITFLNTSVEESEAVGVKQVKGQDTMDKKEGISSEVDSEHDEGTYKNEEIVMSKEKREQFFDGTNIPGLEPKKSLSCQSSENDSGDRRSLFPEKAVAITNFMRVKSAFAVSSVLRHLLMKEDDEKEIRGEGMKHISGADNKEVSSSTKLDKFQGITTKNDGWNPFSFIGIALDSDPDNKGEPMEDTNKLVEPIPMKGRILLYTRLGCCDCKEARILLHLRRLRYVEINIDVYPSRKCELEKYSGSSAVPKVFFNEVLIGSLSELKELDESGKLNEKIEYVISEVPSFEAPLPPLSGEDDASSNGSIDELALIVRNMKSHIAVKDRFYKMRRFTNTFIGSEAVDFLSEDQFLEREEAIQFGRKLARNLFFQHVLEEHVFEDSNDLYRFLDDDPFISQCQNIPRGIIEVKPKTIVDISSRLKFICFAIFDAYTSKDGNHVDYRSIHGSEEFARYLRIVEELQRVDLYGMAREEKLAFFINLYNMMAIHAILDWGHPAGALERKKLFGDFKYVIGGCSYSLSDIQNGILRGNQRTAYTLTKTFGGKDKRSTVALSYLEPLVHFALVCGTRSGPALRCYSSGDIDKELMEAAHKFLRSGGLIVDLDAKIASVSKILKWFRSDFGKNENEALKHAVNYLEPQESQALLELLDETQLKVVYQPYDWGLNN